MVEQHMEDLITITHLNAHHELESFENNRYALLLINGKSSFSVDFTEYHCEGKHVICLSPYQHFKLHVTQNTELACLQFHGDFYCIEYHKKEVACNGLLFNAIYLKPYCHVSNERYDEILTHLKKIATECSTPQNFAGSILKSYLQLILALCSAEKSKMLELENSQINNLSETDYYGLFKNLLETHFTHQRSPKFYAEQMAISVAHFSKKIKSKYGKSPSLLIQERVTLEAKKLLHLTHKSIKEIATELHFEDEFYFSRYFKKYVGLSPAHYREKVGVSIVAKLSME